MTKHDIFVTAQTGKHHTFAHENIRLLSQLCSDTQTKWHHYCVTNEWEDLLRVHFVLTGCADTVRLTVRRSLQHWSLDRKSPFIDQLQAAPSTCSRVNTLVLSIREVVQQERISSSPRGILLTWYRSVATVIGVMQTQVGEHMSSTPPAT
jgi:hypothetical protein